MDNNQTLKHLIRWVAILPSAVIAPIIGACATILMLLIGDLLSGNLWVYLRHPELLPVEHFFTSFIVAAIFGYLFVNVGTTVAPKYKKAVAFVLFGCIAIVFGFLLVTAFIFSNFAESWRFIVNSAICIIASGFAAFFTKKINSRINYLKRNEVDCSRYISFPSHLVS